MLSETVVMANAAIIIKAASIGLVLIGALLLGLSLPHARKIQANQQLADELRRKWRITFNLILFFLFGYIAFDIALFFGYLFPMILVTATVFFGGACLVFLTVHQASIRSFGKRQRLENRMSRLNDCLLGFSHRHSDNIKRLTNLCGELMEGVCALYNRIDGGVLSTISAWNAPADLKMVDKAEGHLCNDVVRQGDGGRALCVRNLSKTAYADSDPNVRLYNLSTYLGMPVKCNGTVVGSLCVVYQTDFAPDEEDLKFLGILASAIGVEEERRLAIEALEKAHSELESRVLERTEELERANERLLVDIAERKKAEEALWKSETILRKVFEVIPDMVAVIDRDLRLIHSNWQGGYEYVPEEIRDACPFCYDAFYPERGCPCDNCHSLQVFRTGKPVCSEKYNPRIGLVEVRAFPILDDSGQVVMVAEYIRNITEQRRLEDELRKAHKLESLGVLAGGIAHDFNNLLTGILGNISLARKTTDPHSEVVKRLDEAEKAVARSQDLTQQLMTFSKGGNPVKKTASIEQIVRGSAAFVLRGSNVRCEFNIAEDVWPVEVDEGQMNQVINNLIINADQAMENGGIIKVAIENQTVAPLNEMSLKEGCYIKISIDDHGSGIPAEHIHRIFDPYFTTKEHGSGLGLATVYSIVKNHDGFVGVESKEDGGASFFVYLPSSEHGPGEVVENKPDTISGTGRILVMDDEELIRDVATDILDYLGYGAVTCRDGREAIDLYRDAMATGEPFSAVLMDLTIPGGMGGRETIQRLLEIDRHAVGVVSSGYCTDPILSNYRDYGFSGIVEKPYSMDKLGKVLHELLG
jgi:signal transduction histidine kinase/CheY-like chemotaxis protein/GAF domain-containing protein